MVASKFASLYNRIGRRISRGALGKGNKEGSIAQTLPFIQNHAINGIGLRIEEIDFEKSGTDRSGEMEHSQIVDKIRMNIYYPIAVRSVNPNPVSANPYDNVTQSHDIRIGGKTYFDRHVAEAQRPHSADEIIVRTVLYKKGRKGVEGPKRGRELIFDSGEKVLDSDSATTFLRTRLQISTTYETM